MCTRNGADTIAEQLDALATQEADIAWELLVVDNGSTDATVEIVRAHDMGSIPVRVVDAHARAGLSFARNVGVDSARAKSIAFCDDDDVVGPTWVAAMHDALLDHRLVASALEYDRLNDPTLLIGRARFQSERIESLFGIPVCSGPCGVHRELWTALGGNDEEFDATGEDFDFAMRAHQREGVTPFFAEHAVYHYRQRAETANIYRQAKAYGASHAGLWARHGDGRLGPAVDRRKAIQDWWWIITRAPLAGAGRNRALWLRKAGKRAGRLTGSARERVFLP